MFWMPLNTEELPPAHDGMLLVKLRPTAELAGAARSAASLGNMPGNFLGFLSDALTMPTSEDVGLGTPGLDALEFYNRQGRIRAITPLASPTRKGVEHLFDRVAGSGVAVGTMAISMFAPSEDPLRQIASGVNFVEVENQADASRLAKELARDPSVETVSEVPCRYLAMPARPRPKVGTRRKAMAQPPVGGAKGMWNLAKIKWYEAAPFISAVNNKDIEIAVLDTGIDKTHPDLKDRILKYTYEWPDLNVVSGPKDIVGHGTHVAGTIAANAANSIGIAGVANCKLSIWKIFDDVATYIPTYNQNMYLVNPLMYRRALLECLVSGVRVINLSIGGPMRPDPQEMQLFNALTARDVAVVAAMGNERRYGSPTSYPAAIPDVIAVGATRPDDRIGNFSNRGSHIWITAPGVAIWSTLPTYPGQRGYEAVRAPGGQVKQGKPLYRELDYDAWPGTSMAAPHVTAATGLLLNNNGPMALNDIRDRLAKSADKTPDMAGMPRDQDYGHGRLNLFNLLK